MSDRKNRQVVKTAVIIADAIILEYLQTTRRIDGIPKI